MNNASLHISSNHKDHLICEVLLHDERVEGYFFDNQHFGNKDLNHLAEEAREIIEEDISNHSYNSEALYFDPDHSYHTIDGAVLFFKRY